MKALTWGNLNLRSLTTPEQIPQKFNFASALLDRHIVEGRGSRPALWGPCVDYTYEQLYHFVNQIGNAMLSLGVERENRVLILAKDSPEWVASHLAAMKIGAVAIGINTFTHVKDYEYFLRHSQARLLIVDAEYLPQLEPFLWKYNLRAVLVVRGDAPGAVQRFETLVAKQSTELEAADTDRDDASHWVYTSGSTGESKGAVHLHRNTVFAAEPYARHVIQMTPDDIAFSVARLFFSYGLMNSYFMPLWVGASVVLMPDRPEPKPVMELIEKHKPTLYYAVPTSYGRMLREDIELSKLKSIRLCVSAGEALPAPIYEEWYKKTGIEILDGVGSTEVGYIFLSNRPGKVAPGTSGTMVPGHKGRLVDAEGKEVSGDEIGELDRCGAHVPHVGTAQRDPLETWAASRGRRLDRSKAGDERKNDRRDDPHRLSLRRSRGDTGPNRPQKQRRCGRGDLQHYAIAANGRKGDSRLGA